VCRGQVASILEQLGLVGPLAEELTRVLRSRALVVGIHTAQMRDDLLTDLRAVAYRTHERPVRLDAFLGASRRVPQVHRLRPDHGRLRQRSTVGRFHYIARATRQPRGGTAKADRGRFR
jgi:hypothetical protein